MAAMGLEAPDDIPDSAMEDAPDNAPGDVPSSPAASSSTTTGGPRIMKKLNIAECSKEELLEAIDQLQAEKSNMKVNLDELAKQITEQADTIEELKKDKEALTQNAKSSDDKRYEELEKQYEELQKEYTIMSNSSDVQKQLNDVQKENEKLKRDLRVKSILGDATQGSATEQEEAPQAIFKPEKPEKPQGVPDNSPEMEQWRNDMAQYKREAKTWRRKDFFSTLKRGVKKLTDSCHIDGTIAGWSVFNMFICIIAVLCNSKLSLKLFKDGLKATGKFWTGFLSLWKVIARGMKKIPFIEFTKKGRRTTGWIIMIILYLIIIVGLLMYLSGKEIRMMDKKHALIWLTACGSTLLLSIGMQAIVPFNSMMIFFVSIPVLFILIEYMYNKYH